MQVVVEVSVRVRVGVRVGVGVGKRVTEAVLADGTGCLQMTGPRGDLTEGVASKCGCGGESGSEDEDEVEDALD
jgi:hypothetical protein